MRLASGMDAQAQPTSARGGGEAGSGKYEGCGNNGADAKTCGGMTVANTGTAGAAKAPAKWQSTQCVQPSPRRSSCLVVPWQGGRKPASFPAITAAGTFAVIAPFVLSGMTAAMAPATGSQTIIQTNKSLRNQDIHIETRLPANSSVVTQGERNFFENVHATSIASGRRADLTTALFLLNRWTLHCSKATEDATVAFQWLEQGLAGAALVEPLAGIRWHCFLLARATGRARNHALQQQIICHDYFFTVAGKPIPVTALASCSGCTFSGSNRTFASPVL